MSYPFVVGRSVMTELGEPALREIARNIWPRDCQSCGKTFAGERPALAVDDLGVVSAALYHPGCRASEWNTTGIVAEVGGAYLSYSISVADVTMRQDDGTVEELPMAICNPSLEQIYLERTPAGTWTCATVNYMREAGLGGIDTARPVPGARAGFAKDGTVLRLSVGVDGQPWDCPLQHAGELPGRVLARKGIAVAITTAHVPDLFPNGPSPEFLQALDSDDVATGWVQLRRSGTGT